jgi:hypothetical protein
MWRTTRIAFAFVLLQPGSIVALTNKMSKVKHVVMFTLQDDVSEEKAKGKSDMSRSVDCCVAEGRYNVISFDFPFRFSYLCSQP